MRSIVQCDSLQDRQTCRWYRHHMKSHSNARSTLLLLQAMVQRSRKKPEKQQHITERENILLKVYTKTGVRNYDHKPFKRLARVATWNCLRSRRFLACNNQTHVIFCSPFQRSSDTEHLCFSKVANTTAEQRAHYNWQIYSRLARRQVFRLSGSLFYYLEKRITNDDLQQDLFPETFRSVPPTTRLPKLTFWKVWNSTQDHFQAGQMNSDHNFKHPL
ncbi:hypothetical protein TNCV_4513151 [Trichonephila clavipes]|nr:hypothetical protein TNCV_4513151 [Trichonephila clavipes]